MKGCICGNDELKYCWVWDCNYCHICDKWVEMKCDDPCCEYCPLRPEKPSDWHEIKKKEK
jgi:hypothetical protein